MSNKAISSLGAAGQDLLAWAFEQEITGGFYVDSSVTTDNHPFPGWWGLGHLVVQGIGSVTIEVTEPLSGRIAVNRTDAGHWMEWQYLATTTRPQIYDLALLDGISPATPTDDNFYFSNQMGITMVKIAVKRTDGEPFSEHDFIATLPEGFRPSRTFFAVLCDASTGRGALLAVRPDGFLEVFGVSGGNVTNLYGTATYLT